MTLTMMMIKKDEETIPHVAFPKSKNPHIELPSFFPPSNNYTNHTHTQLPCIIILISMR